MSSKPFLLCAALAAGISATVAHAQVALSAADYLSIGLVNTLSDNIGNSGLLSSGASTVGKYYLTGYSSLYAPTVGTSSTLYTPMAEASFNGAWANNTSTSQWYTLSRDGNTDIDRLPDPSDTSANFTVTLNFDLSGYSDAGFNINMAFDDSIAVYLNGNLLGLTGNNSNRYQSLGLAYAVTEGTTNNSFLNQGGENTLTFVITNLSSAPVDSATGFLVQFDGLAGNTVVPEPSTYGLILGAGALGVITWRRRKQR
ncbi:MAG TPA: PEP-CTERM sorting domain-containing protein [Opitutaceae bacterium]|nr:PEP-CTERM sorting domain-containing protein [Opitutaceae bacterium]